MNKVQLAKVAKKMVVKSKGILAADESSGTIQKRFATINATCTERKRREYREMLFTSKDIEKYISGVILFDETMRQKTKNNVSFPKYLANKGVLPGIKVDMGKIDLPFFDHEMVTEGLDGLQDRLHEYKQLGAKFAKWRAVIVIGKNLPTNEAIDANAHGLARYAALCQLKGIVPIVEPEVLMDGNHTIQACEKATERTLKSVFSQLKKYKVHLPGMILKPNMVLPGKSCKTQASPNQIAKATVRCFYKVVPKEMPGCVFLSGGQSPEEATQTLNAINSLGKQPWELSYSYGRALQGEALQTWAGKSTNIKAAQAAFINRAEKVAMARMGKLT